MAFLASFERHSKKNKLWTLPYERRPVWANSESTSVKAKRSSAALSEEDIQVLFEKDLLESSTAEVLLDRVWFNDTILFGLRGCKETREMCWGDVKLCQNFHRAGVPRIQWKGNQNSSRKRSTEYKSHCNENVCCAEQREMSSKGIQSLRRKATRGNENRRCTVLFGCKQCKIWPRQTSAQKKLQSV